MFVFITLAQHNTGISSQYDKSRKGIKGTQFRKEEIKLALFAPDMVVLVENPKKSKKYL